MKIWWMITEKTRKKLATIQRRRFQTELNPPAPEDRPQVQVKGNIESTEEIERIMRQPPSRSHDKDGNG
ncbi:MAG: hypothetical protein WC455_20790 [Dehalococcoidia bacterium]|jgi:hypothetical protein